MLEEHTERLHELAEKDLEPFLDQSNPDRKPFILIKALKFLNY